MKCVVLLNIYIYRIMLRKFLHTTLLTTGSNAVHKQFTITACPITLTNKHIKLALRSLVRKGKSENCTTTWKQI